MRTQLSVVLLALALASCASPITLRHLMTHTSGLPEYEPLYDREVASDYDSATCSDQLALLAAIAVERSSGMSIEQYARTRIFGPLTMTHSDFVATDGVAEHTRAYPYDVGPDGTYRRVAYGEHFGPTGVRTNIPDLQRWADSFYSPGVLSSGAPVTRGFGFEAKQLGGFDAVLHSGVTVGTRAAFARFPQYGTSIALLCNGMNVNTERVVGQVAALLLEQR